MRRNCWGHLWFLIFKGDAIFEMLFLFPETNYGPFADQKKILIKDTEFKDTEFKDTSRNIWKVLIWRYFGNLKYIKNESEIQNFCQI